MSDGAVITRYWLKHYCTEHCTICGNCGVIDSRGTCTAAGLEVGRLNYCICPNGQVLRNQKGDKQWWLESAIKRFRVLPSQG